MMRMKNIRLFLLCAMLCALCVAPASAPEYTVAPPDDYTFGRPISEDTIYEEKGPNVDRSKHTALIPPAFGSPTSYLPSSGEALTQNLLPGGLSGGLVNSVPGAKATCPEVDSGGSRIESTTAFTDVTSDFY